MGVLDWLGIGSARPAQGPDVDVLARIGAELDALPPERARLLAAFAYLLGRVAHADHAITPEETSSMQDLVREFGGLTGDQAEAVVLIAQRLSLQHRGTEDFRVGVEFAALASDEDKKALLRCLFALSASDDAVVTSEDNEIRRISRELKIPHNEFIEARAQVRDRLAVLRRS